MRPMPTLASRRLSWSRWWVLALMMLCLPLQGVLAVTMQMGMAVEHHATAQASHARHADHAGHAGHAGHAVPASHANHASHASHDPTRSDPVPLTSPGSAEHCTGSCSDTAPASDTHHGCSFCAQCCIGVALLATPLTVAAALPADSPPAAVPTALLERQPQTPDRPPKHDFV